MFALLQSNVFIYFNTSQKICKKLIRKPSRGIYDTSVLHTRFFTCWSWLQQCYPSMHQPRGRVHSGHAGSLSYTSTQGVCQYQVMIWYQSALFSMFQICIPDCMELWGSGLCITLAECNHLSILLDKFNRKWYEDSLFNGLPHQLHWFL